jgi:hypothetical protein
VLANLLVLEDSRAETGSGVALSTIAWHTLVRGWGIMAASTGSRSPLEPTAAVAAVAGQQFVHTGELEVGVVKLGRFPAGRSMALGAAGGDPSNVIGWYLVARFASR